MTNNNSHLGPGQESGPSTNDNVSPNQRPTSPDTVSNQPSVAEGNANQIEASVAPSSKPAHSFEVVDGRTTAVEHAVSGGDNPVRYKLTNTALAVLLVLGLALIVVPGVLLGVLTKELQNGIALSSGIAAVMAVLGAILKRWGAF